jgi:7-cyano-7-deazaguanine synthase
MTYGQKGGLLGMTDAMVLLSGGMDSTICLYWAKERFHKIEAITFDYGQRHSREIQAAIRIALQANVEHRIIPFSVLGELLDTALTRPDKNIQMQNSFPNTFVPNRNLIFFALASAYGIQKDIRYYVGGMCQVDYSNYPDCRREALNIFERAIGYSLEKNIIIYTPLMDLTKAESLQLAQKFDGCMEALALSHTCYHGTSPACGACPACKLRIKGFQEAGLKDPIKYES